MVTDNPPEEPKLKGRWPSLKSKKLRRQSALTSATEPEPSAEPAVKRRLTLVRKQRTTAKESHHSQHKHHHHKHKKDKPQSSSAGARQRKSSSKHRHSTSSTSLSFLMGKDPPKFLRKLVGEDNHSVDSSTRKRRKNKKKKKKKRSDREKKVRSEVVVVNNEDEDGPHVVFSDPMVESGQYPGGWSYPMPTAPNDQKPGGLEPPRPHYLVPPGFRSSDTSQPGSNQSMLFNVVDVSRGSPALVTIAQDGRVVNHPSKPIGLGITTAPTSLPRSEDISQNTEPYALVPQQQQQMPEPSQNWMAESPDLGAIDNQSDISDIAMRDYLTLDNLKDIYHKQQEAGDVDRTLTSVSLRIQQLSPTQEQDSWPLSTQAHFQQDNTQALGVDPSTRRYLESLANRVSHLESRFTCMEAMLATVDDDLAELTKQPRTRSSIRRAMGASRLSGKQPVLEPSAVKNRKERVFEDKAVDLEALQDTAKQLADMVKKSKTEFVDLANTTLSSIATLVRGMHNMRGLHKRLQAEAGTSIM